MAASVSWGNVRSVAEFGSWLALIASGPAIFVQLRQHRLDVTADKLKERIEIAEKSYLEVELRFGQLMMMCIDRPRLDGYSTPRESPLTPPLSDDEMIQQKLLYSAFTNMFEVAFFEYQKKEGIPEDLKGRFAKQWRGWETYIRKFHRRAAYRAVWSEIKDEYDEDFVAFVDKLAGRDDSQLPI
jgi:hypothetical protein